MVVGGVEFGEDPVVWWRLAVDVDAPQFVHEALGDVGAAVGEELGTDGQLRCGGEPTCAQAPS